MNSSIEPFFSIIIPVFNREKLLHSAIYSVLKQTFCSYEIIAIDDGSTDNSAKVLEQFGSSIKLIKQRNNKGCGGARNLGIQEAQGSYIVFLDSDDILFPWALKTIYEILKAYPHLKFLASKPVFFHEELILESFCYENHSIQIFSDYYSTSFSTLCSTIYSASGVVIEKMVLLQTRGFTELKINAEDLDLWLRLGTVPGFAFIHHPPIFAYRQHPNSAISDYKKTVEGIKYLINQEQSGYYPGGGNRSKERLAILTRHIRPVSLRCLREFDFGEACYIFYKSLIWHIILLRFRYIVGFMFIFLANYIWFSSQLLVSLSRSRH